MSFFKVFLLVFTHHSDKSFSVRFHHVLRARRLFNSSFLVDEQRFFRLRLSSPRSYSWSARRDYLNYLFYNINSGVY